MRFFYYKIEKSSKKRKLLLKAKGDDMKDDYKK